MRYGRKTTEENIKADAKPKDSVTVFFENVLNKRKDPMARELRQVDENIKNYELRKNY